MISNADRMLSTTALAIAISLLGIAAAAGSEKTAVTNIGTRLELMVDDHLRHRGLHGV